MDQLTNPVQDLIAEVRSAFQTEAKVFGYGKVN